MTTSSTPRSDAAMLYNNDTIRALREALDLACATVELHTGNGAQTQPDWPRDSQGNIAYNMVALRCRAVLATPDNYDDPNNPLLRFVGKVGWKMLREQKAALIDSAKRTTDPIMGVVHLIDGLQDAVVESCLVEAGIVFGNTEPDPWDSRRLGADERFVAVAPEPIDSFGVEHVALPRLRIAVESTPAVARDEPLLVRPVTGCFTSKPLSNTASVRGSHGDSTLNLDTGELDPPPDPEFCLPAARVDLHEYVLAYGRPIERGEHLDTLDVAFWNSEGAWCEAEESWRDDWTNPASGFYSGYGSERGKRDAEYFQSTGKEAVRLYAKGFTPAARAVEPERADDDGPATPRDRWDEAWNYLAHEEGWGLFNGSTIQRDDQFADDELEERAIRHVPGRRRSLCLREVHG